MDDKQRREFTELRRSELKTARAWALKETAMNLYDYVYEKPARKHFQWYKALLTIFDLWSDFLSFIRLSLRPRSALAAENLFLRKELARLPSGRKLRPERSA